MYKLQGRPLTAGITLTCGFGFMLFGYDQGVFGGLLSNPAFLRQFDNPDATIQSQIVSTYDIGCIVGAFSSIFIGDRLGRRLSIGLGCTLILIGGLLQSLSYGLPQMIVGRVVAGLGLGMNTATIPMWQSETAKPSERGKLIVVQMVLVIFGIVITEWMNFGFTFNLADDPVSWRFPLGFQGFFALVTIGLVLIMPESPRWLVLKDRHEDARVVIANLDAKPVDSPEVAQALNIVIDSVRRERLMAQPGLKALFAGGKQQTFRRLVIGSFPSFMQQMGGINVVVYYLPIVLVRSFGFSNRLALILSAVDSISLMFWGSMGAFLIDRVGRRNLLMMGSIMDSICFAVAAAGLSVGTKASNAVAVTFVFLYYVFYGMSLLSIPFMYPAEINSQTMRNTGCAVAMIVNWLFVYVVVLITPPGIQSLDWKYYLIYAALNLSFLPFVYFFIVETAGLSLEEIDLLFEIKFENKQTQAKISYKEAARLAKEKIREMREEASDEKSDFGGAVVHAP